MTRFAKKRATKIALSDLENSIWLEDPQRVRSLFNSLKVGLDGMSAQELRKLKEDGAPMGAAQMSVIDGVAQIPIVGHILKDVPCVFDFFGIQATSTNRTRDAIRNAVSDPDITGIHLIVDSPGGTLAGVGQLADEIFQAREFVTVTAHAEDLAASAAVWIAAQAERFTANETAEIGSIGVFTVVHDMSRAFEAEGIDTHVISTGEFKGAFVEGAKVTDEQLADEQRLIDQAGDLFVDAVARGRNLDRDKVIELRTGQVWFAAEATALGLIDAVEANALTAFENGEDMDLQQIAADMSEDQMQTLISLFNDRTQHVEIDDEASKKIAEQAARIVELEHEQRLVGYIEEAKSLDHLPGMGTMEMAELLMNVDDNLSSDFRDGLRSVLKSAAGMIANSESLKEKGSVLPDTAGDAMAKLHARASALRQSDPSLSKEQAFLEAAKQHPELYSQHQAELRG